MPFPRIVAKREEPPTECCEIVWYQEGKGGQFPYPTAFEWTGPKDWPLKQSEWRSKATRILWSIIGWTEKGMQVTLVAQPEEIVGEEKKKPNDWPEPFIAKMIPFRQIKFWKGSLVWGQRRIKTPVYSQNSGSPRKKIGTESLDRSQQRALTFIQILENATRP